MLFECSKDSNGKFLSNESVYGKAPGEAYFLEEKLDWLGCVVTLNAWKRVCKIGDRNSNLPRNSDPNSYFIRHPYLVWYQITFKDSPQAGIIINWNSGVVYDSQKKIETYLIQNSFCAYEKGFSSSIKETRESLEQCYYLELRSVYESEKPKNAQIVSKKPKNAQIVSNCRKIEEIRLSQQERLG